MLSNEIWSKLTNTNILSKEISDLQSFRSKILTIGFYMVIFVTLIITALQQLSFGTSSLPLLLIILFVSGIGLYFLKENKIELSRLTTLVLFYVVLTISLYLEWISFRYYIVTFTVGSLAMLLLSANKRLIWIEYFLIVVLTATAFDKFNYRWIDITITLMTLGIFFITVRNLIITLQSKLVGEIKKVKSLNQNLKVKNEHTQLFTNIMVHDIKAPLKNIKGFSQLISKKLSKHDIDDSGIESYIATIDKSIGSLEHLIEDLLVQIKIEQNILNPETINLSDLINPILDKLQFQILDSNAKVELENLGSIVADKRSLSILFNNLISNALKYQPKNEDHIPKISIKQINNEDKILVKLSDNGIGIEEKYLSEMFTPFKRFHSSREYDGTGLGLSLCKLILKKHNGEISVKSTVNVGTEFTITLPRVFTSPKDNSSYG